MAGKFGKGSVSQGQLADIMGVPRPGEEMVDMHNRMTSDFNKNNTITPGDKPHTMKSTEKKQGAGFGMADIGVED